MVLIFTTKDDISAQEVAHWVVSLGHKVIFIYEDSIVKLKLYNLNSGEFELQIDHEEVKGKLITSVWFRKIKMKFSKPKIEGENSLGVNELISQFLELELDTIEEAINYDIVNNTTTINDNNTLYVNKLLQLKYAIESGLNVPTSIIMGNSRHIRSEFGEKRIITKGIYESFKCNNEKVNLYSGTELVNTEKYNENEITFFPSLFQNYLEKEFEIRTFFLNGKFFSMAIFSQNNDKTVVDYRNYDLVKPNRMIPYNLPPKIEEKLVVLMKKLSLNCGSIDLIYTPEGNFYFLEVNPVGQFSFLSGLCNYNIERKIAEFLCEKKVS